MGPTRGVLNTCEAKQRERTQHRQERREPQFHAIFSSSLLLIPTHSTQKLTHRGWTGASFGAPRRRALRWTSEARRSLRQAKRKKWRDNTKSEGHLMAWASALKRSLSWLRGSSKLRRDVLARHCGSKASASKAMRFPRLKLGPWHSQIKKPKQEGPFLASAGGKSPVNCLTPTREIVLRSPSLRAS